ncbi:phosphatase PAP2 family protein [Methanonatronarchaeum sp. AMET6-2]|uniref:phosphatase PAP2 family protein n=1 Tax=Methanonatronarchaeum sp. AMET6-2 TaxID=2933293 RepID=UPI0012200C1F|nr:phosphatase PAP2 family protein [Methanonatronarchaeum sp. AMET6-2]RZN62919.1 MAG: phosphatase PAP2 family protein [Methanonatronarchaeia archaeon]UOY09851.1 phosphatase PAP2 family protein [Methanonatronarchaeum sp. AMET6-2]
MYSVITVIVFVNLLMFYLGAKFLVPNEIPLGFSRAIEMVFRYKTYIIALILVFLINTIQNRVLSDLGMEYGFDLTPFIYGVEGNITLIAQQIIDPLLTGYMFFTYVFIYIFLIVFSISLYVYCDAIKEVKATVLAYLINYMVALPFFLFLPVYEAWMVVDGLAPLLFSVNFPANDFIIWVNGVNNCMPSLHTSISITVAVIATLAYKNKGSYRLWMLLSWIMALSVVFSTMYLGVHWILDVIAGIILGAIAGLIGYKVSYSLDYFDRKIGRIFK